MVGLMEKVEAKVEQVMHPHQETTTTTTTTHGSGVGAGSGAPEGTYGPHSSKLANAADPRVDSDADRHAGAVGTGVGSSTHGTGAHTGLTGTHHGTGAHTGLTGTHHGTGAHAGLTGTHGTGVHDTTQYSGTHAGNGGLTGTTGTTGGISDSTNAGPHNSNLMNKMDPRVDSDLDGSGNRHGAATGGILGAPGSHATPGSGTAQNTAGPHNSDMMNQLDPRVDADLDGSKTVGGNRTHF